MIDIMIDLVVAMMPYMKPIMWVSIVSAIIGLMFIVSNFFKMDTQKIFFGQVELRYQPQYSF